MLTRLNSFGCSFTSGTELPDHATNGHSHLTWPALIARKYSRGYLCHAQGGIGNLAVAQRIINKLAIRDPAQKPFVWIVNWTFLSRFDFNPSCQGSDVIWNTLCAARTDDTSMHYFKNISSELQDKLVNLLQIQCVISLLLDAKIPFLMTCLDDLLMDTQYHCPPAIRYLQDQVHPYMTWFEGQNFLAWSRRHGFPLGPQGHPLQEAHAAAAEVMAPVIESILHTA